MTMVEGHFDNEAELETWVFQNIEQFAGECIILGKFQITTSSGKMCVPDGFSFNFKSREWSIIECELLSHKVWPHIAEQITRFVVALQNPTSIRKIRDRLFDEVIQSPKLETILAQLNCPKERLYQQLEFFVEGLQPSIRIFIDDTNQDLDDFARALDMPTSIYRIRKFFVNGGLEYYSPDSLLPILTTTPDERISSGTQDLDIVEQLGGGTVIGVESKAKYYKLNDERVLCIRRSKYHERNGYYWYGISPTSIQNMTRLGVTHLVFVLGDWGFATTPLNIVKKFCEKTKVSSNADGSVRHYHLLISPEPDPKLYFSKEIPDLIYPSSRNHSIKVCSSLFY